jgi:hypothetical protein
MVGSRTRTGAAGPDRVVAAAAAPLTVACGLLLTRAMLSLHSTLCCDSQGYFDLAQALISQRPRALASHIRTYGCPTFLAWISFWQPRPVEWVHAAAAGAQGALRAWRRGLWVGCAGLAFLVACAFLSGWIQVHGHSLDIRLLEPAPQGAL